MGNSNNLQVYIKHLAEKFQARMPEVRKQIKVYEAKLQEGKLTKNPTPAPQFNG